MSPLSSNVMAPPLAVGGELGAVVPIGMKLNPPSSERSTMKPTCGSEASPSSKLLSRHWRWMVVAEVAVAAGNEDVGGAVVRLGGPSQLEVARDAHDHVAVAGLERIAHEAAALRPPRVRDSLAEIFGHEVGDGVFEALLLLVGVGKVVRIGADAEGSLAVGCWLLAVARDHEQRKDRSSANSQQPTANSSHGSPNV